MAMNSPEKSSNTRSMLTDTSSGRKFHVILPESIYIAHVFGKSTKWTPMIVINGPHSWPKINGFH